MGAAPRDADVLAALVTAIDEGRPVDWDAAERDAGTEEDRATIRELRVLADIASLHRDPAAPAPANPGATAGPPAPADAPQTWGSLRVHEPIGRGAFGIVYRAIDKLDREVALKLMPPDSATDPANRARILHEGRMLARLSHPNVVSVYGADEVDGQLGLWMQFIHGSTLEDDLEARGPFGAKEATLIGLDVCRALAAVHGEGLLHRDVKAQNVMREAGGRTLLIDLGAGLDLARDMPPPPGRVTGTPLYLAPELLRGKPPTVASDIYSVGVLLYHLASAEFPVDGATADDIVRKHDTGERRRLRDVRADLPDDFVRVVERALAVRPEDRYRSAGELEEALGHLLPAPAPRPTPVTPWKVWVVGIAAVAALTVATLAIVKSFWPPMGPAVALGATDAPPAATPLLGAAAADGAYRVEAAFHRVTGHTETRLARDARLAPGDQLFLTIQASRPVYTYVYNEDEAGESYLLYPLPGQSLANPLPAGRVHRLPGTHEGDEVQWTITSAGGREHFLVFVSPERDPRLEAALEDLAPPVRGRRVEPPRLSQRIVGTLRGVGGLASAPARPNADGPRLYPAAPLLGDGPETVSGLWVRRLTLANP